MKHFAILSAALTAAFLNAPAYATEINLGHVLNEGTWYDDAAQEFKRVLEEETNGEMTVNVFPSGQLGGELKVLQSEQSGAPVASISAINPMENFIPEFKIFSLPYVFDSIDQAATILRSDTGKDFLAMMDSHGFKGLGFLTAAERNVFGNRAVKTAADMQGMKIRVIQAPGYVKTYEAFGAQPTPMAFSEQYLAMQNGVVDAGEGAPEVLIIAKFSEVSKYYNMTQAHYMPIVLTISKAFFDGLPVEQQEAIQTAADAATALAAAGYKKLYDESFEQLPDYGVEVIDTDLTELKEIGRAAWDDMLTDISGADTLLQKIDAAKKAPPAN